MIDALVGALIAVTATTALLAAAQISESVLQQAGGAFLIESSQSVMDDLDILADARYDSTPGSMDRKALEDDLSLLPPQFLQ